MKGTLKLFSTCIILGLTLLSCLDSYSPPSSSENVDYLVVDGNINSTDGQITVKLTQAVKLTDIDLFPTIDDAQVRVEDQNGFDWIMPKVSPGVYRLNLTFSSSKQYKIRIRTANGKNYSSDLIFIQRSADIDSVTFKTFNDRLELYSHTHDFSEGKKYYYITYEETHEYNSVFSSSWMIENSRVVFRPADKAIYTCWLTRPSDQVLLASTENLSQNIIANNLVMRIPKGDRRLWKQYSLLVRQTGLDKAAFDYWRQIQKLTESLGGLFDPLPYSIKGNIKSDDDPNEPVLGYFSGSEVKTKRILIRNRDLPGGFSGVLQTDCVENKVSLNELNSILGRNILLTRGDYMAIFLVGYYYSEPDCVDCRYEGGTNVKPPFMN